MPVRKLVSRFRFKITRIIYFHLNKCINARKKTLTVGLAVFHRRTDLTAWMSWILIGFIVYYMHGLLIYARKLLVLNSSKRFFLDFAGIASRSRLIDFVLYFYFGARHFHMYIIMHFVTLAKISGLETTLD